MNAAARSKTFKSGNSEAVRLPQGIGFGIGAEVHIKREGNRVVITPALDPMAEKQRLLDMLARLKAIGAPPSGVQERDPFEFPDRPGL